MTSEACPPDLLNSLLEALDEDDQRGLERLDALLLDYGADARLHFLRGSILAGLKRYEAAIAAIGKAVELDPDFAAARFQLGFLHYTSGDPQTAEQVWRPLAGLPETAPPRLFAQGLVQLARDEIEAGIATLEQGMALNHENPPMNGDMRLLINTIRQQLANAQDEPLSSTQLLLQRFDGAGVKH
jgi:tetratricopeptide (TPR) repeat protein